MGRKQLFLLSVCGLIMSLVVAACGPTNLQTQANPPSTAQVSPRANPSSQPSQAPTKLSPEVASLAAGMVNPPRKQIRLMVISDLNGPYGSTEYDPEVDRAMQLIPFWQPDMVICSGDMVAGQDITLTKERMRAMWRSFDEHVSGPLRKMKMPYGFTLGNHDASSALGANGQFLFKTERDMAAEYWQDPAHDPGIEFIDRDQFPFYFTFKYKDIFFISWDGSSNHIPKDKLAWAEKALASPAAQQAKMRILLGHLPLYAVSVGRNEPSEVMENADQLLSMLEKANVHTHISGHHHSYYPGHRGKLQTLQMGILGAGPRPLIEGGQAPRKALTILDIDFNSPEVTTYTTYDMRTMKPLEYSQFPKFLTSHNGIILRRDVEWAKLTETEKATCLQRLGEKLCQA